MDTYTGEDNYGAGVSFIRSQPLFADGTPTPNPLLNHLANKESTPTMVILKEKRVHVEDIRAYFITRDAEGNAYLYIDRGTHGNYVTFEYSTIEEATADLTKLDKIFGVI